MPKKLILLVFVLVVFSLSARQQFYTDISYESVRADSAHGFDVLHYDITMAIDDQSSYLEGTVVATIQAEELLTEITLELAELTVDEIRINEVVTSSYEHIGENINIQLDNISAGATFYVTIDYSGNPQLCTVPYPLGMFFTTQGIYTISDPNAARYWWPCYDHPWDKATVDLHITAREDWGVAANGIRTSIEMNYDGTNTHNWEGSNPMATYLVSLVLRPFVELNDSYGEIPIQNFVSPGVVDNATEDFENLPFMMETFSELFGEYPFEKYGNAVTNFSTYGAMEHQTMTTLSSSMIDGNHGYETIIAHELAHQWFGNSLTPLTWKDVWLSEGFATYSEVLYMAAWQGETAANNYLVSSLHNYYKNWAGSTGYTVYDPAYNALFTPATYEKPASVLHMLRLRVGDDDFFEILQTYFQTYENQNVVSSEFIEICETVSGQDLQQFFQQWIFEPGLPTLEYSWFVNEETNEIKTFVKTACNTGTEFFMKVPFKTVTEAGTDSLLVDGSPNLAETIISFENNDITDLQFDPDNWLLHRGSTYKRPEIENILAADETIILNFSNWDELEIAGYNLYRSETETGNFELVNSELISEHTFLDSDVENSQTYYYKVKAVQNGEFMSQMSEVVEATPMDFPMDMGILVVDETKDGNGAVGNPSDEDVDNFYANVISQGFTSYDIAAEGSLSVEEIANYSTVIWHDDDFTQNNISESVTALASYIAAGGNLIISGWKTASSIPQDYRSVLLQGEIDEMVMGYEFIGTESSLYPQLNVDQDKIHPAFNGTLPFITIFPEAEDGFYLFEGVENSTHQDAVCGLKSVNDGVFIFLGFPLYYMQNADVTNFFNVAFQEISNLENEEVEIIQPNLTSKAYPNPFNPTTTIMFNLPVNSTVNLAIYNVKGQKIKSLIHNQKFENGRNEISWNGIDQEGKYVSTGIYFYKLQTDTDLISQKILLIK